MACREAVYYYFTYVVDVSFLFSCKERSFHGQIAERKLKGFLSIHSRGWSKQSSCCDYAPVSTHFTVFAWRGSPVPSRGKRNINIFDLFVTQDVSIGWHTSFSKIGSAGMSQLALFLKGMRAEFVHNLITYFGLNINLSLTAQCPPSWGKCASL